MGPPPGGRVDGDESLREAARRELAEEAGVEVDYEGLATVTRVEVHADGYDTWGVLPVFEARAESTDPTVSAPDGEISEARWFADFPDDTRDRDDLLTWRDRAFGGRTRSDVPRSAPYRSAFASASLGGS